MTLRTDELLADPSLVGVDLAHAHRMQVDAWLVELFRAAVDHARPDGVSLVALGGYGRGELSLQSDLDVLLLHDDVDGVAEIADRLWYPVWDGGVKLGHAVRTQKEALALAADDLDSATALLSARHLAGDAVLAHRLAEQGRVAWERRGRRWLDLLATRVDTRHARVGEVAFHLEPDLKEGRGGLRDVHALGWAEATGVAGWLGDPDELRSAHDVLFAARVEVHRLTGRSRDRLLLQDQDAVARRLGDHDADALMRRVSEAARTIAWTSDEVWRRLATGSRARLRRPPRDEPVSDDFVLRDGRIAISDTADLGDPTLALAASLAAVEHGTRVGRETLQHLAVAVPTMPDPWPAGAREVLVALLARGRPAIAALEALDHFALLSRVLPEWDAVRSRPQRNAYHTFTVDRHLCEAAANAAELVERVRRPDLLLLATWLHDIGKGFAGDHTEVGMELVGQIARRMGLEHEDVVTMVALVEQHLLLPDAATRRDLDDPATISSVAETVGDVARLRLLAALTEADALATGPWAWGSWKAELVETLVQRVEHVLGGGDAVEVTDEFPGPEHRPLVESTETIVHGDGDLFTVATADRPGLLSTVTGVLALHGIDVLEAQIGSVGERAVEVLRVQSNGAPVVSWEGVERDLRAALKGRLAIRARLAERERTYARAVPLANPVRPSVTFHHDDSAVATIIEIRAADAVGLLFKITTAFLELDLDIVRAKVETLAHEVVDTFYVRTGAGEKLDPKDTAELERALLHAVS